jgi:ribosome-associated translation inhibitor RaiA
MRPEAHESPHDIRFPSNEAAVSTDVLPKRTLKTMNIELKFRGVNGRKELRDFLKEQVETLEDDLPVTSAMVVVEHQTDITPPFWIWAHLVVPGPDIFACARDHTPLAAWLKVSKQLNREMKRRKTRQVGRLKTNLQLRGLRGRQSGTSGSRRA